MPMVGTSTWIPTTPKSVPTSWEHYTALAPWPRKGTEWTPIPEGEKPRKSGAALQTIWDNFWSCTASPQGQALLGIVRGSAQYQDSGGWFFSSCLSDLWQGQFLYSEPVPKPWNNSYSAFLMGTKSSTWTHLLFYLTRVQALSKWCWVWNVQEKIKRTT